MGGLIGRQDAPSSIMQYRFTAIAGQTVFQGADAQGYTLGYSPGRGNVLVFRNGSMLAPTDFTALNGSSVTLAVAAAANDVILIVAIGGVTLTDTYRKGDVYNKSETYTQAEARGLFGLDQAVFNILGTRRAKGIDVGELYRVVGFGTGATYSTTATTNTVLGPTSWDVIPRSATSRLLCIFQMNVGILAGSTNMTDNRARIYPGFHDGTNWTTLGTYDEIGANGETYNTNASLLSEHNVTIPIDALPSHRSSATGRWLLAPMGHARVAGTTVYLYLSRIFAIEYEP